METVGKLEIFLGAYVGDFGIDGKTSSLESHGVQELELEVPHGSSCFVVNQREGGLQFWQVKM